MTSIFIDGSAGTTGQKIKALLAQTPYKIITIPNPKDSKQKQEALNDADLALLCLPDEEAKNSVALLHPSNKKTKILDCSSAFRTSAHWVYGLPELNAEQAQHIANAQFVSNPGCYATGAIALLAPLTQAKVRRHYRGEIYEQIVTSQFFSPLILGFSGYSGGGKKMIEAYQNATANQNTLSLYSLDAPHKHSAEIKVHSRGLKIMFQPAVLPIFKGMVVAIPLMRGDLNFLPSVQDIQEILKTHYERVQQTYPQSVVQIQPFEESQSTLNFMDFPFGMNEADELDGNIYLKIYGSAQEDKITLTATLDNLGKGAAMQAMQNIRLMLE